MPLYIRTTSGLQFPGAITSLLLKHFYPLSLLFRFHWHCPILKHTTFLWGRSNRYNYSFPFATPFYPTSYLKGKETCALEVIWCARANEGKSLAFWLPAHQTRTSLHHHSTPTLQRSHSLGVTKFPVLLPGTHYHRGDACPDRNSRKRWWLFTRHFFTSGPETSGPEDSACSGRPRPGVMLAWRRALAHL